MKILIYGSAHLTSEACKLLNDHYDLVGHIPSIDPVIAGKMDLPIVDESVEHDIKLSLQYNRKMKNLEKAFNVHTGLLPLWGGQDILYHTLKELPKEQGLTFHKMTDQYDYGNIISKITYPVYKTDTMVDLYTRMTSLFPAFVLSSLKLLADPLELLQIDNCPLQKPRLFRRGQILQEDLEDYEKTLPILRDMYE